MVNTYRNVLPHRPLFTCQVACFPQFSSEDNPAKYPPIKAGEYLLGKYSQTHQDFDASQDSS